MALFPSYVNSETEALGYLARCVQGGVSSITTATVTLTAAQAVGGLLVVSGGTTCGITLPPAAQVVAAFPQAQAGQKFSLEIVNNNSGTATFIEGTGNTITGTKTVATTLGQRIIAVITNAAPGSEAVTYYPLLHTPA